MLRDVVASYRNNRGVKSFKLSTGVRRVLCICQRLHRQLLANHLKRFGRKLQTVIGQDPGWCFGARHPSLLKKVATVVAVAIFVGKAFARFESLSAIATMRSLPASVFGEGPRMSTATNYNGQVGGNSRGLRFTFVVPRFLAPKLQSFTVLYTFSAMKRKCNSCRLKSYIHRSLQCPAMTE